MERERDWIQALRAGEPAAFERLLRELGPRLLGTATRLLGDAEEAQDAVQEAFVATWKGVARFEGKSALYTWIHRILVNVCLARLRSAGRRHQVDASAPDGLDRARRTDLASSTSRGQVDAETRVVLRGSLQTALAAIDAESRTILLLRDVEGLSSKEVAAQLGVSDAVVRQRLHRARTAMADLLRPELCVGRELTCGGRLDLLMDLLDAALDRSLETQVTEHVDTCPTCGPLSEGLRSTIAWPAAIATLALEDVDEPFVARTLAAARRSPTSDLD